MTDKLFYDPHRLDALTDEEFASLVVRVVNEAAKRDLLYMDGPTTTRFEGAHAKPDMMADGKLTIWLEPDTEFWEEQEQERWAKGAKTDTKK